MAGVGHGRRRLALGLDHRALLLTADGLRGGGIDAVSERALAAAEAAARRRAGREPAAVEQPEAGTVVWCDDACVACRRWNWRR